MGTGSATAGTRPAEGWLHRVCRNSLLEFQIRRKAHAQQFVLLLGHMRCGSTVATNVLCSNPEVAGIGEAHIKYKSERDLLLLTRFVCRALERSAPPRYIMDKCLHPGLVAEAVLKSPRVACVFMAREPASTLRSMINVFPDWFGKAPRHSPQVLDLAVEYYSRRLEELVAHAEIVAASKPLVYFSYEEFLSSTAAVFASIQKHLGLQAPLTEEYQLGPLADQFGRGDVFGTRLKSQRITREEAKYEVSVPADRLPPLQALFQRCDAALRDLARRSSLRPQPLQPG